MNGKSSKNELLKAWYAEESIAQIHGWDFSHINDRYEEEGDLPWDYKTVISKYLQPNMRLLDIDTGGGEFLLSLGHCHALTAATENYPPNVELCKNVLLPLGIDFRQGDGLGKLPFKDESFDIIINRHGDFKPTEIRRLLKADGVFITQQVGAQNDRELVELLYSAAPPLPFPKQHLEIARSAFEQKGFQTLEANEAFRPIKFYDVGALVWFARIIQWEFPGFSVDSNKERLFLAQELLEKAGVIQGSVHRFMLVMKK